MILSASRCSSWPFSDNDSMHARQQAHARKLLAVGRGRCWSTSRAAQSNALRQHHAYEAGGGSAQGSGRTLVLELCEGDLGDLLRHAPARLDEALAKGLARQLLRGLAHMHGAGARPHIHALQLLRSSSVACVIYCHAMSFSRCGLPFMHL